MGTKRFQVVCIAISAVLSISNFCFAKYSGGSGTAGDPYRISNPNDMLVLSADTTDYGKAFILLNDIDMTGYVFDKAVIAPANSSEQTFDGFFDGGDHKITHLTINGTHHIALFGHVGPTGSVKNLGIEDCDVNGVQFVGSLAGYNEGSITNCYSTSNVKVSGMFSGRPSTQCIGGLVGNNSSSGSISNCSSASLVVTDHGGLGIGGLAGSNSGYISQCYSTSTVGGLYSLFVGGVTGWNSGSISKCYSTGSVSGGNWVGGLVGVYVERDSYYGGNIENCYSTGAVSGGSSVGGLCGSNGDGLLGYGGLIRNCYSTGTVSGNSNVGGLCGSNADGNFVSCYFLNTAGPNNGRGTPLTDVQMKQQASYTNWDFGNDMWIMDEGDSYPVFIWQNIFVVAVVPNITGMTEADANAVLADANFVIGAVKTAYSFTVPQGYVIEQMPAADILAVEGSAINIVISLGTKYSGGSGQPNDPYRIANPNDLLVLSADANDYGKAFILINDIDMTGYIFDKAVIAPYGTSFSGIFDGDDHKITHLTIKSIPINRRSGYNIALFGEVGPAGAVKNLGIEDCDVNGVRFVGSLAGWNEGSVTNCYSASNAIVSGASTPFIGGLVGLNRGSIGNCYSASLVVIDYGGFAVGGLAGANSGDISQSYSSSLIISYGDNMGGLVGWNNGSIRKCYSTGSVSGRSSVGGLVGMNIDGGDYSGSIENCYSTGAVTGDSYVGGLCGNNGDRSSGYHYGQISNCYSTGTVSGNSSVGGLCGSNEDGNFVSCYFLDMAGPDNGSGEPLIDTQMKQQASFTGWDFSYSDGNGAVWFMAFDGYPILNWQISDADIYTDGNNNFKDFTVFANYWMREDCAIYNYYCQWSDMDFDHDVDVDDLAYFMSYWLEKGIY